MSDVGNGTNAFQDIIGIVKDSLLNNIVLLAIMVIIYLYISADKGQAFVYADIFVFMGLITNPKPCDKKKDKPASPPANAPVKMGGASEQLSSAASSIKNVGNAINALTANVKQDVEYERYIDETLSKYKETYCDDIDTMSLIGAFFFVMHSSFLACYNAIQFVNTAIIRMTTMKILDPRYYAGIMLLYILFLLITLASSSMVKSLMKLLNPKPSKSETFLNKILFSIFSALISLFILYFVIACIAYMCYLTYGLVNIKSEQSDLGLKSTYFVFLILIPLVTIPSIFGVSVI